MKRTIVSALVLVAAAVALAGCGGGGGGGGVSASETNTGNAGTTQTSEAAGGSFRTSVHGFQTRLKASLSAFQHGNIAGAAKSAGPLLTNCDSVVNDKIGPKAKGKADQKAIIHLDLVCQDIDSATQAGLSGKTARAKRFAQAALSQAQMAAKIAG